MVAKEEKVQKIVTAVGIHYQISNLCDSSRWKI